MWINYGDINYFEHGGCQVRPTYSEEEIKKYPALNSVYDVFYLIREGELILAALCTVDVDDSWIDISGVLKAIGLEDQADKKYGGLTPERFACELVEYYGVEEFNPICFKNRFVTEAELKKWMIILGIK